MKGDTEIWSTRADLRAVVARLIPTLKWRHHGIGCLQGYVSEDVEPEVRVHVWSPLLVKPGIDGNGDVHDHRFDLVSHVVAGTVYHEEWKTVRSQWGGYRMTALTHARAAADTNYHGPMQPMAGRFNVHQTCMAIQEGCSYSFRAHRFHRSPVRGLAVSLVEKHAQREDVPARLLHPVEREPVNAFGHEMDHEVVDLVVSQALEALTNDAGGE